MLLLLAGTGCSEQLQLWEQLKDHHSTIKARVTRTNCADHGSVFYEFRTSDKPYTGVSYWIDKPCKDVKPGELIVVYYNPDAPRVNSTMTPARAYEHYKAKSYEPFYFAGFLVLVLLIPYFRNGR